MLRKKVSHMNHERWLVSYADFITLLFAFFVVLYASSQIDKRKVGQLTVAIKEGFQDLGAFPPSERSIPAETKGASDTPVGELEKSGMAAAKEMLKPEKTVGKVEPTTEDFAELRQQLETVLAAEIARKDVSIGMGPDGLVLSLREAGFFDSGSAKMRPLSQASFSRLVRLLRQHTHKLRIEGHTDNVPIHTEQFTSNWELSTARATEVVKILITKYQYPPSQLAAAGYGEFHPVSGNSTLEGRRNNRRVDLVVLTKSGGQGNEDLTSH